MTSRISRFGSIVGALAVLMTAAPGVASTLEVSPAAGASARPVSTCTVAPRPSADLNGDGRVDVLDLVALIINWGECADGREQMRPCTGDLNGDGSVDGKDLSILLAQWE